MRYQTLESLRGIAALIVALFHSSFIPKYGLSFLNQGDLFVDFFFVLSGFVIAYAYIEKINIGLPFKYFLLLRLGRLYPLHLFVLLVWVPFIFFKAYLHFQFGMGSDPLIDNNLSNFIANLFLINAFGMTDRLGWNGPAWSIGAELFAYIAFFLVVYSIKKKPKVGVFVFISLCSYLSLYFLSVDTLLSTYQYGFLRCLGGFFFGALLFCLTKGLKFSLNKITASLIEVVIVLLTIFCVINASGSKAFQFASFMSFGFIVVVFSMQEKGYLSALLKTKFMLFLGLLSYSIYMTHSILFVAMGDIAQYILGVEFGDIYGGNVEPVTYFNISFIVLVNVFSLGFVIIVSSFTYKYIERPWRDKCRAFAADRMRT